MKYTVNTKYNIGDMVYLADLYYDYIPNGRPHMVHDIEVHFFKENTVIIYCVISEDNISWRVVERYLFSTYEECTEWCKKENKGENV